MEKSNWRGNGAGSSDMTTESARAAERIVDVSPERLAKMKAWCEQRIAEKPWFRDAVIFPNKPEMSIDCHFMVALIDFATTAHAAGRHAMREEAARVADGLSDAVQRAAYPQGKLAQVLPESNCYRRVAAAVRALAP